MYTWSLQRDPRYAGEPFRLTGTGQSPRIDVYFDLEPMAVEELQERLRMIGEEVVKQARK